MRSTKSRRAETELIHVHALFLLRGATKLVRSNRFRDYDKCTYTTN